MGSTVSTGSKGIAIVLAGALLLAMSVAVWLSLKSKRPSALAPASAPATSPAPSTIPSTTTRQIDYMDVVRAATPGFPTTRPLAYPLSLAESARIVIADPVYLDEWNELWITRRDGATPQSFFKAHGADASEHVVSVKVLFVHHSVDQSGNAKLRLICPDESPAKLRIISSSGTLTIPVKYENDWKRAVSWNDSIVVPTSNGVSIFRPDQLPVELHYEFESEPDGEPPGSIRFVFDMRGLLAWKEHAKGGAARFVDGKWSALSAADGWPGDIVQFVPFLDGSVLQIFRGAGGAGQLAVTQLDRPEIDAAKIDSLIDDLSDADSEKRNAAFAELTRWGPGAWPILEKRQDDQTPEARIRIEQLLADKQRPTLGGMRLLPGPLRVAARDATGGGVVILCEAGVTLPSEGLNADGSPIERPVAPAWVNVQPGRSIELLSSSLVGELQAKGSSLAMVRGEFFVNDDTAGPRQWISNHFADPLLKPDQIAFRQVLGQDRRGRWLLRRSELETTPTLVIDPTLPDPTPRLPIWVYRVEDGEVGWTPDGWPAVKRGGAWALLESDWKALDPRRGDGRFIAATRSREQSTTATTRPSSSPLLSEPDGTRYFGGTDSLTVFRPGKSRLTWPLPPGAVGRGAATLIRAGEDRRLYLFNGAGRIIRLRETNSPIEPFAIEQTFVRNVPNEDDPARIWLDPAGRIIIAPGDGSLAICFPSGRIPAPIAQKMTASDLKRAEQ